MRLHLAALALAITAQASDFPTPYNSEQSKELPMPAEEAARTMKLPPGFRCSVFASEPEVQNPIAMAWDHRGRLWIAENNTYAERPKRFDLGLRDRVIILEDTDNDGHADKRTVFTDKVQMLTSIEIGKGGVWLMCPPQVLFIPDKNEDDVPDAEPQVVLDGFTVAASNYHNFANGLRWGPDGWLYGRCGHSCPGMIGVPGTPDDQRVPIKGGVWRYHPERKIFETLIHGTTNPWGHDWDSNGELFFINTVTGHLWHMMPGAHLVDSSAMQVPGIYQALDTIADHYHFDTSKGRSALSGPAANDFGGGHAHIGMMIYQGDAWPAQYRGELFTLNMHGRRMNNDHLERLGCGYVGRHRPDFMLSEDPFFRGIDLSTGPDGNVLVIDWSDIGECHESTGVHRTSGRVYKISYGDPRPVTPLPKPMCLQGGGKLPSLWKQYQEGRTTPEMLRQLLCDEDEHVRVWAIRLLTDFWPLDTLTGPMKGAVYPSDDTSLAAFVTMARDDKSGLVRLVLASVLQRLPLNKRASLATELVRHCEDAGDQNLPSLVWYGLIPLGESEPMSLVNVAMECSWPSTTTWIARRLTERIEQDATPLGKLLRAASDWRSRPELQDAVACGMADALRGWRKAPPPPAWESFAGEFSGRAEMKEVMQELRTVFGEGRALEEVKQTALDNKADLSSRQAALKTLIAARPTFLRDVCESLLEIRGMGAAAARGLALFDDPALGLRMVQSYRKLVPADRNAVLDVLTTRPSFAKALLDSMGDDKGQIARADITAVHARQIRSLNEAALTKQLGNVWGELHESSADKQKIIADLKTRLDRDHLAQANLGMGRLVFQSVCASCHTLYGEGGKIGPDLTGSGRANIDYLLENIADPSAVVSADFRMSVLTLKDGRVLSGLMRSDDGHAVTLRTVTEEVTIEKNQIAKQEFSPSSMMPDGLLPALQPDQVRDLIAYLMHPVQVELPR